MSLQINQQKIKFMVMGGDGQGNSEEQLIVSLQNY